MIFVDCLRRDKRFLVAIMHESEGPFIALFYGSLYNFCIIKACGERSLSGLKHTHSTISFSDVIKFEDSSKSNLETNFLSQ